MANLDFDKNYRKNQSRKNYSTASKDTADEKNLRKSKEKASVKKQEAKTGGSRIGQTSKSVRAGEKSVQRQRAIKKKRKEMQKK